MCSVPDLLKNDFECSVVGPTVYLYPPTRPPVSLPPVRGRRVSRSKEVLMYEFVAWNLNTAPFVSFSSESAVRTAGYRVGLYITRYVVYHPPPLFSLYYTACGDNAVPLNIVHTPLVRCISPLSFLLDNNMYGSYFFGCIWRCTGTWGSSLLLGYVVYHPARTGLIHPSAMSVRGPQN